VYAETAENLGFDSMWTAEHHFHNHGFEVVPNVVLLNAVLAQRTQRIRLGALVHVLTTWHPVRFAEDFALADLLFGGRLLCGLGRGTEPRESDPFGVNVGWNGDPDDIRNREVFEEQVAIFKVATANEEFSFRGKHYIFPPDGLQFRGEPVNSLPLAPRPTRTPVRIYPAMVRHLAPELVHMERAEGYLYQTNANVGYSFKGQDVIEAWVTRDLSPTGAIGNPHRSSPEKGQKLFEAKVARLAELLQAIYYLGPRDVRLAPAAGEALVGANAPDGRYTTWAPALQVVGLECLGSNFVGSRLAGCSAIATSPSGW
jgi:hypothetical protein